MNQEARELIADAERAAQQGDWAAAREAYLEAGDRCAEMTLHRNAQRCYRRALEIDLTAEPTVNRLIASHRRTRQPSAWEAYLAAIPAMIEAWPSANARFAQLVVDDDGAMIRHPSLEHPIARVEMGDQELTVTRTARFAVIPDATILIILRRLLWPAPRDQPDKPVPLAVVLPDTATRYRLFETGDWE